MRNYLFLSLLVFSSFIYFYSANPTINVEPDTWKYLIISKSLSEGNGYRDISHPNNPPENLALPLYPLMLVPVLWFTNNSFLMGRMVAALIATLSIPIFYLISKEFFDKKLTLISTTLIALSPMVVIYSHKILTEIPYMFFSLLTVYLIFRYDKKDDFKSYAFVLPLYLSLFTKISGMVLIISIIAYLILKKDFRRLIVVSCIFLLFVGFLYSIEYYHFFSKNPSGYTIIDHFTGKMVKPGSSFSNYMLRRAHYSVLKYFGEHIPSNILTLLLIAKSNGNLSLLFFVIGFTISLIILLGYLITTKGSVNILKIYVPIHSFVFVFLIGVTGNGRYLLPVLPFFMIYFIIGLRSLTSTLKIPKTSNTLFTLILYLLLFYTIGSAIALSYSSHNKENTPQYNNLFAATQWIKLNVNSSEVIATNFWLAPAGYIFTGNKVILAGQDYNEFKNISNEYEIKYLLIDGSHSLENNKYFKNDFKIVFSIDDPSMKVYKFGG